MNSRMNAVVAFYNRQYGYREYSESDGHLNLRKIGCIENEMSIKV